MTNNEIVNKSKRDEFAGEKLLNKFRLGITLLYALTVALFAVLRKIGGLDPFPVYGFIPGNIFLLYSVFLVFYFRKRETLHWVFKYVCVIIDMTIVGAIILVGSTYPELDPPIKYLSIWALLYNVFIILGAFRYNVRCAYFSGTYAGLCYLIVIIAIRNALDFPYYFVLEGRTIDVGFPIYNEVFRIISMVLTGVITGIACKRHIEIFKSMIESETAAAEAASKTAEQTREMAKTIQKSTDEIFLSSKDIFSTANNQAVSVQEIESTMSENMRIAAEIADKTSSVATITSKMENDVIHGFSVLESNVEQLRDIKKKNDGVISGIIALGNKITKIRDIVKTINTITDQTKVIAFNAALEAASAGDRGKRFAVVANEVNRLADDIAALTKQIREQVEEIQNSSSQLIISSEEGADKITEGNNLIKELEDIFRKIRSGAEITANQAQAITVFTQKQQKSIEQINVAIADISTGLSNFINSTEVATSSAGGLTQMIHELGTILSAKTGTENGFGKTRELPNT